MMGVPYIHIHIHIHVPHITRIAVPSMWGSLRLAPITGRKYVLVKYVLNEHVRLLTRLYCMYVYIPLALVSMVIAG